MSSLQETDFVCFDTGYDDFNSYDIDALLGSSLARNDDENKGTSEKNQVVEDAQEETQPLSDEAADSENQTEHREDSDDLIPIDIIVSDVDTESLSSSDVEYEAAATPDANESAAEDRDGLQKTTIESLLGDVGSQRSKTKDALTESEVEPTVEFSVSESESVMISEGVQIPDVNTTYGTTFDAVTTDEDITKNVTPYEEEESVYEGNLPEGAVDLTTGETLLLSFSEEVKHPTSDSFSPPTSSDPKRESAEENMWPSLGDAVFSVVTGGETVAHDLSSDEDEGEDDDVDDDDDNDAALLSKIPQTFEGSKEDVDDPAPELAKVPQPGLQNPTPNSIPTDDKETDSDSEKLPVDHTDEHDGDTTELEENWEKTSKPTEASPGSVDPVSQRDTPEVPEAQKPVIKTAEEPIEYREEDEVSNSSDIGGENVDAQNSSIRMEHSTDLDNEADSKPKSNQELAVGETNLEPFTDEMQAETPDLKNDEIMVDEDIPDQIHDQMTDLEKNNSQPESAVKEPEIHEELLLQEFGDDKDTKVEEEGEPEELMEDENALYFSQSNTTDFKEPSPEVTSPSVSATEPEYSDSVMRLTLLRDHFTEEKIMLIQKRLGLKNLFKVEAMFSDLDTELQATRRSHTDTTQDIENALEAILETSENTILDEIEKMLDSQVTEPNHGQHMDTSRVDEETEILDEFQELAFSLRQKYSTASDTAPLAREKEADLEQGLFVSHFIFSICAPFNDWWSQGLHTVH